MLREISGVRQDAPGLTRRWFQGRWFDLFLWQDAAGEFTRFQLCYDIERNERALVWSREHGFFHDGVEHGEHAAGQAASPIFVPDGKFDSGTVVPRFEREAAAMPVEVREFVLAGIRRHLIERHQMKAKRRQVRREAWQRRRTGAAAAPDPAPPRSGN
jgi:hypothetical protein